MGKAGSKKQARKRAKRRELLHPERVTHPWEKVDLSDWIEDGCFIPMDVIPDGDGEIPCMYDSSNSFAAYEHSDTDLGIFPELTPAEANQAYWVSTHFDQKQERLAAYLAMTTPFSRKDYIEHEKGLGEDYDAKLRETLKKLSKLADEGSVTACAALGAWYHKGVRVRKNKAKAQKYLLAAAEFGDPYSCFLLAETGCVPERNEELYRKSFAAGCPSALCLWARRFIQGKTSFTDSASKAEAAESAELFSEDKLPGNAFRLAAFAHKKIWPCLDAILAILCSDYGTGLREEYAGPMLKILQGMAGDAFPPAMLRFAVALSDEVLCEADFPEAEILFQETARVGVPGAKIRCASFLLRTAVESLPLEKTDRVEKARALLRESCREKDDILASSGLLGCSLVRSARDKEFMEGMRLLKSCLQKYGNFSYPRTAVLNILHSQASSKRLACAASLAEMLAEKHDLEAVRLLGFLCLLGIPVRDKKKGLELLNKAAKEGSEEACCTLAEVYLFGLFSCRKSREKALAFARQGEELGSRDCLFWRTYIELGEPSPASAAADGRTDAAEAVCRTIKCPSAKNPISASISSIAKLWYETIAAADHLSDEAGGSRPSLESYCRSVVLDGADYPASLDTIVPNIIRLACLCDAAVRRCQAGTVAFFAHELRKMHDRKDASFYSCSFSVTLNKPEPVSCKVLADGLADYLKNLPESHAAYLASSKDNIMIADRPAADED